jgi:hypothetical protein
LKKKKKKEKSIPVKKWKIEENSKCEENKRSE